MIILGAIAFAGRVGDLIVNVWRTANLLRNDFHSVAKSKVKQDQLCTQPTGRVQESAGLSLDTSCQAAYSRSTVASRDAADYIMNVVAYARVSTPDQSENGISLDAQKARMNAYAGLYQLDVIEVVVDAGESAKSLNRPGLQRALALLKAGKADGLVVVKLDRLTRSVADWQVLIDDYFGERPGKQLLSVNDSIDTRTASGRLVLNILLSVAAWEREAVAERTRAALQHKIRNGERCGAVRFGYDVGSNGRSLIPNVAEQQAITLMIELRDSGSTLRRIAAVLAERGIPTKEGNAKWTHTAVARILKRQEVA